MKKIKTPKLIVFSSILLSLLAFNVAGQTVVRSSINSIGSTKTASGLSVQSTTGQPYSTRSNNTGSTKVNPGFIQSNAFYILEENEMNELAVQVYPNPATYLLQIDAEERLTNATLKVHSINGTVQVSKNYPSFSSESINCSEWSNGTYIIELSSGKRSSKTKLIINN